MAAQKSKKDSSSINLLPQEEFDASTTGRVLKWLLSTFRYIVIITEMVVMASFLSRFWLDAKINDLIDNINEKKQVISSYSTFENKFRETQEKIAIFKTYSQEGTKPVTAMAKIASQIPTDITLTQLSLTSAKLQATGTTLNEAGINTFIKNLSSTQLLTNIGLSSLESKDNEITFTITADAK